MDGEELLKMDSYMLLSILNMKLRDEFDSLYALCEDYDVSEERIKSKLKIAGYRYQENRNQFIAADED